MALVFGRVVFAEKQILNALPIMARAVQRMARRAFFQQKDETEGPIERPQRVFETGKPARDKTCGAIRGIISQGEEIIEEFQVSRPRR